MINHHPTAALAQRALACAMILGALGDWLLRVAWGLGFSLWIVAVAIAAVVLVWARHSRVPREVVVWLGVAAVFAAGFTWRHSDELQVLDVIAILSALGLARLASVGEPAPSLFASRVIDLVTAAMRFVVDVLTGALRLLVRDARPWPLRGRRARAGRVAMTVVATLALVLMFGALFVGADPVFAAYVRALHWDLEDAMGHVAFAALVAWAVGGALRGGLFGWELPGRDLTPLRLRIGVTEVCISLGGVLLVFMAFVAAQVAWLAGGAEFVRQATNLTFAEFARRGFFQLVWVAALLLVLLLVVRALVDPDDRRAVWWYRRLAGGLVVLLAIIVFSAAAKLRLYVHFYGLSTARFYAAVAIIYLSAVFVWLAITVLRDRVRLFAGGAVVAGFAMLAALHLMNPDLLVARYNLSHPLPREAAADPTDFAYLATLSSDAVPALVPALLERSAADRRSQSTQGSATSNRCRAAATIYDRWYRSTGLDWRSWNASVARARRMVTRHERELARVRCALVVSDPSTLPFS